MSDRISVDPSVHFGKPCVAGTRIPVIEVLTLVERGMTFDQITTDYYPDLAADDVRACIRYAMEVLAAEHLHVTVSA